MRGYCGLTGLSMKIKLYQISIGLILIGSVITLFFIVSSYLDGYRLLSKNEIDFDVTGQFGNFIGGVVGAIFSLLGTVLIYFSFREQTKQNKRQAFESKFYELVRIHNDNVKEIKISGDSGREVFETLLEALRSMYLEVWEILGQLKSGDINVPNSNRKHNLGDIQAHLITLNEDELKYLAHQLSYGYYFYGREKYYLTREANDILFSINSAVASKMKSNRLVDICANFLKDIPPVNAKLGHYYRHAYQIIKLLAEEEDRLLPENEKYQFAKIVRSLLSDNEQILLYYNSLSKMGDSWQVPLGENEVEKMCFIARFRLIKNIPDTFCYFGIHPAVHFKTESGAWEKKGKKFFETIKNHV